VLYPIVFLSGYFISAPFLDSKGVPFWLSLFVGNLFSTQLLGWLAVPVIFPLFGCGTLEAGRRLRLLLTLHAISMAGYAWLLSRAGRIYESSDAVLMRVKKPIDSRPFGNRCVRSPPVDVPIGTSNTSNTFRSLLFAVCSSTINKAIEYIILKPLDHWFLVRTIPDSLNYQGNR
jgi:hypothetical protein